MAHTTKDKTKLLARVRRIKGQAEAVERALEAELGEIGEQWDPGTLALEPVLVKPKRGGVEVTLVTLVWVAL